MRQDGRTYRDVRNLSAIVDCFARSQKSMGRSAGCPAMAAESQMGERDYSFRNKEIKGICMVKDEHGYGLERFLLKIWEQKGKLLCPINKKDGKIFKKFLTFLGGFLFSNIRKYSVVRTNMLHFSFESDKICGTLLDLLRSVLSQ